LRQSTYPYPDNSKVVADAYNPAAADDNRARVAPERVVDILADVDILAVVGSLAVADIPAVVDIPAAQAHILVAVALAVVVPVEDILAVAAPVAVDTLEVAAAQAAANNSALDYPYEIISFQSNQISK